MYSFQFESKTNVSFIMRCPAFWLNPHLFQRNWLEITVDLVFLKNLFHFFFFYKSPANHKIIPGKLLSVISPFRTFFVGTFVNLESIVHFCQKSVRTELFSFNTFCIYFHYNILKVYLVIVRTNVNLPFPLIKLMLKQVYLKT